MLRPMTKDEINCLEVRSYEGPVHLVRTQKALNRAVEVLCKEPVIGFDTETRPAFKKGVSYPPSLLQMASKDDVFVFQLQHLDFPGKLLGVLEDAGIVKSGIALAYDIKELRALSGFDPGGFVDIAEHARCCGIPHYGLRGMTAFLLGFRISKNSQVSNWARNDLTKSQLKYAATDAWVGRELYLHMVDNGHIVDKKYVC